MGRSQFWIHRLLQWRNDGFKGSPFEKRKRIQRDIPGNQKKNSRAATTAERAQAQTAKANAELAKAEAERAKAEAAKAQAEFQRARAEAKARMFPPQTKTIPAQMREPLIKALRMLASKRPAERASAAFIVEEQRARLNLTWEELIVPAELEDKLSNAA
jgi:hypothetical protein